MAVTLPIFCTHEGCEFKTSIRIDPGPEDYMAALAANEVEQEHPHHDNRKQWAFLAKGEE